MQNNKYKLIITQGDRIKEIECSDGDDMLDIIKEYIYFEWAEPFGKSIDAVTIRREYIEHDTTSSTKRSSSQ